MSLPMSLARPAPTASQGPAGVPAVVGAGVVLAALTAWHPAVGLAGLAVGCCGVLVWMRPAAAALLVIGLTPLTVGIDRGSVIPLLRPNEALDVFLAAVLTLRWVLGLRTGQVPRPRLTHLQWAMVSVAVTSSVWPLVVMVLRQQQITGDDISYAMVMWKYLMVYAIVRASVRTSSDALRCLRVSMVAAALVALIAVLQALQLWGVPGLLARLYTTNGNAGALTNGRGSATLGLPAAVADLMIYNLAVALALLRRRLGSTAVLGALAAVFAFGAVAAGEFSSALGMLIGLVVAAFVTGTTRMLLRWLPTLFPAGVALLWPVISTRLSGFDSTSGLPASWTGRLHSLENYFWPRVFSGWNWLLGVRPSARLPDPHRANGYLWIESGYTWLLWGGGIPLLVSFLLFVWVALRSMRRPALHDPGPGGAAATGVYAGVIVMTVLMAFDPHLTYRGAADCLVGLVALAEVGRHSPDPSHEEVT
jgi:hypothetical protein